MVDFFVTIKWINGFHLRPASAFVKKFAQVQSEIKILYNDNEVDGKSILGLSMLAVPYNGEMQIKVSGDDEEEIAPLLVDFFFSVDALFHLFLFLYTELFKLLRLSVSGSFVL